MKVISNVPKNRVVELHGVEMRARDYHEELLDRGWDIPTATRYVVRRFGWMDAQFRRWLETGLP